MNNTEQQREQQRGERNVSQLSWLYNSQDNWSRRKQVASGLKEFSNEVVQEEAQRLRESRDPHDREKIRYLRDSIYNFNRKNKEKATIRAKIHDDLESRRSAEPDEGDRSEVVQLCE